MRTEIERIQDQLRRAIDGDAWHGPSVTEAMESVAVKHSGTRPYADGHSACEIVLHIAAWLDAARRRIAGEPARLTDVQDWPPPTGEGSAAWEDAMERLHSAHDALQNALDGADDAILKQSMTGQSYTKYTLLHGAIQHALYHAGQLVLMSRMAGGSK